MFDKELFYSLCDKYQVELSDKYDNTMIKDGEEIKVLNGDEVKKIFSDFKSYFSYSKSEIRTKNQSPSFFEFSDYPKKISHCC